MTGQELKALRARMRLTQVQLAAELGVDPNTIARWEQGRVNISKPMALLLERVATDPRTRKGRK